MSTPVKLTAVFLAGLAASAGALRLIQRYRPVKHVQGGPPIHHIDISPGPSSKETKPPEPTGFEAHSRIAEEVVIGSALVYPEAYYEVADTLPAWTFYVFRNRLIWEAMEDMRKTNDVIDFLSLIEKLDEMGELDMIGGATYVAGLVSLVPAEPHAITRYADTIKKKYKERLNAVADSAHRIDRLAGFLLACPLDPRTVGQVIGNEISNWQGAVGRKPGLSELIGWIACYYDRRLQQNENSAHPITAIRNHIEDGVLPAAKYRYTPEYYLPSEFIQGVGLVGLEFRRAGTY